MTKHTLTEKQPDADSEIIFKSKSNGRILLAKYYEDCKYLVGNSSIFIEQDYDFEDVEWWAYTKDL